MPRGQDAVGWVVEVKWVEEDEWYTGVVSQFDLERGYYVVYEDGDEQWEEDDDSNLRFIKAGSGSETAMEGEDTGDGVNNNDGDTDAYGSEAYEDDEEEQPVESASGATTPPASGTSEQVEAPVQTIIHT